MQIKPLNQNSISFKRIELNDSEQSKSLQLFDRLAKNNSEAEASNIVGEIFDIFQKHIEREAEIKGKKMHVLKEDYLQSLYLKFFENLKLVTEKSMNFSEFLNNLNNFHTTKHEINPETDKFRYSLNHILKNHKEERINRIVEKDLPVYATPLQKNERDALKMRIAKVLDELHIAPKKVQIIQKLLNDKTVKEIALDLDMHPSSVSKIKNRTILQIQKEKGTLPQEFLDTAEKIQKTYKLDMSTDKIINSIIRDTSLLNSDELFAKIDKTASCLKITPQDYAKAIISQPALFYITPQDLKQNIKTSAQLLKVSDSVCLKAALKNPALFYTKPETLLHNITNSANIINVSPQIFIKTALKRPPLFSMKPETINKNIKESSALLGTTGEQFVKAAVRIPQLFFQTPETINTNIEKSAKTFNISKPEFVKMALSQPSLFCMNADTLKQNVVNFAKTFNLTQDEALKIAKIKPQLLLQNPKTIEQNAQNFMELFNLPREVYIKTATCFPDLFIRQPEGLYNNIKTLSDISGTSKKIILQQALSHPTIFCQKPETVLEKEKIKQFAYKMLSNKDYSLFSSSIRTIKKENYFENILKQLLKKELKLGFSASEKVLETTIQSTPKTDFVFNLPEHEIAKEFRNYVQSFFATRLQGKNCIFLKAL